MDAAQSPATGSYIWVVLALVRSVTATPHSQKCSRSGSSRAIRAARNCDWSSASHW